MFVSSALKKNEIFEGCAALLTGLPRRGTHAIRHARVWGVGSRAWWTGARQGRVGGERCGGEAPVAERHAALDADGVAALSLGVWVEATRGAAVSVLRPAPSPSHVVWCGCGPRPWRGSMAARRRVAARPHPASAPPSSPFAALTALTALSLPPAAPPCHRSLTDQQNEQLTKGFTKKSVSAKDKVINQGEDGDHFNIVQDGKFEVSPPALPQPAAPCPRVKTPS